MRDCSTGVQEENKDQIKMGAIWDLDYVYVYNVFLKPLLIEIISLKKIKNLTHLLLSAAELKLF